MAGKASANRRVEQGGATEVETDGSMLERLAATLAEAGIHIAAEIDADRLVLSGEVDSEANRQAALDVAGALAEPRGLRLDDAIEVMDVSPDGAFLGQEESAAAGDDFAYADPEANPDARFDPRFETEPDFMEDVGTSDSMVAAAEAVPYFPPTDPVVRPTTDEQQLAVVGGFETTAMDDRGGASGADPRNDDELARSVHRALREDALTIDLAIRIGARDGVVVLRGEVTTLEDAENAEAVASRVEGVSEVREELTLPGLSRAR